MNKAGDLDVNENRAAERRAMGIPESADAEDERRRLANRSTAMVRHHSADDMNGLRECVNVFAPVAVVVRSDGSLDVYGHMDVIDQREATGAHNVQPPEAEQRRPEKDEDYVIHVTLRVDRARLDMSMPRICNTLGQMHENGEAFLVTPDYRLPVVITGGTVP